MRWTEPVSHPAVQCKCCKYIQPEDDTSHRQDCVVFHVELLENLLGRCLREVRPTAMNPELKAAIGDALEPS